MTTINLKDFYAWYTHDEYIEVSDEVAAELKADKLYEAAHQRRTTRNKAQYSLDCDDGIEYSACLHEPTPQELLDRMELFAQSERMKTRLSPCLHTTAKRVRRL